MMLINAVLTVPDTNKDRKLRMAQLRVWQSQREIERERYSQTDRDYRRCRILVVVGVCQCISVGSRQAAPLHQYCANHNPPRIRRPPLPVISSVVRRDGYNGPRQIYRAIQPVVCIFPAALCEVLRSLRQLRHERQLDCVWIDSAPGREAGGCE